MAGEYTQAINSLAAGVKGINSRLDGLENNQKQLYKMLEKPASKAGVSPQAMVADASEGGRVPGLFGPDGKWFPYRKSNKRRTLDPRGSSSGGDWLKALCHVGHIDGIPTGEFMQQRDWAMKTLSGIDQWHEDGTHSVHKVIGEGGAILKTAMAESVSGSVGGYAVPPAFYESLMRFAVEGQFIRPKAYKIPMTTLTLQIPALDLTTVQGAAITPFLGGLQARWTQEAATRFESEPKVRQTELKANELALYAVLSNTLLQDNAVGLEQILVSLLSDAIGFYTEYAYLQGNGLGQPMGLLNAPATLVVTKQIAASFTMADVFAMISHMYWMLRGNDSLCWAFHPSVIPAVLRLNDQSADHATAPSGFGRFAWTPFNAGMREAVPESDGVQSFGSIMGWPAYVTEKLPALGTQGCVMLIERAAYVLGDRLSTQIDVSPHVNFLQNQTVWRLGWRGDGQPWLNNPITLADGVWQVSPFLTLTQ